MSAYIKTIYGAMQFLTIAHYRDAKIGHWDDTFHVEPSLKLQIHINVQ